MNKDPNVEKQIEELARSFCGFSKTLKCSECSYECHQKEYARKAFEDGYRKTTDMLLQIIESVDQMFERQVYDSAWVDESLQRVGSGDICSAAECWNDFIKKELIKKYTEGDGTA